METVRRRCGLNQVMRLLIDLIALSVIGWVFWGALRFHAWLVERRERLTRLDGVWRKV